MPVLPRDPRREGLHPRPGPGAPGGARRRRSSHGLGDPAVAEALDLCLACKGCASDCPTGVDMATYKAEVLHQTLRRPDAAGGRAATTCSVGCRAGPRWPRRWRRWPTGCCGSARSPGWPRPPPASTSAARSRPSRRRTLRRGRARAPRRRAAGARRVDLGRLVHRPLLPANGARRDRGCWSRPGCGPG